MSGRQGQRAELRVGFATPDGPAPICTLKLGPKGDLYLIDHMPVVAGKHSLHSSGAKNHTVDLLGIRKNDEPDKPFASIDEVTMLWGLGGGQLHASPLSRQKRDTKRRKSLLADWPGDFEPWPWGVEIWAVPASADDSLRSAVREALPHPGCAVQSLLTADWTSPAIVAKVWRSTVSEPFRVIKATNEVTGETFMRQPPAYEGTVLAREWTEEELWLPRPLPRAEYGPEPWNTHPAFSPEVFQEAADVALPRAATGPFAKDHNFAEGPGP